MRTATLIGDNGERIECWEPRPGFYIRANSRWTEEEARTYAETGEYPQRLLDEIRRDFEKTKRESVA